MNSAHETPAIDATEHVNVAARLVLAARERPNHWAVVAARRDRRRGIDVYDKITFAQLDDRSDRVAAAVGRMGVRTGMRLVLAMPPGIDFITCVFALLKAGVVAVLIDPGMGARKALACLGEVQPDGFVAPTKVQAIRVLYGGRFRAARHNIAARRHWLWRGPTLEEAIATPSEPVMADTRGDDAAAIIFTSGSTGAAKGVEYTQRNFDTQVSEIRDRYAIEPGGVDLACFPLFGLFNAAMGVTTVVPRMDPSRPATADPASLVRCMRDWGATQSFASPAVWSRVGPYCVANGIRIPTLRKVYSAGAPVAPPVLETMRGVIASDGDMHTPYGATEALPVASISAKEVLSDTRNAWTQGKGTCVGAKFDGIEWRVVEIVDGSIAAIDDARPLPRGEIGELIVRGPVVTGRYVTRVEHNALAKIRDGNGFWHRMGDVGYFDERERFWYCGRLSQRVVTRRGTLFTEPCEAIFQRHASVSRAALVGVGPKGSQTPVIVCEPRADAVPSDERQRTKLINEIRELGARHDVTRQIQNFLLYSPFPVDVRHNAKINRESLATWAAKQVPPFRRPATA